jgi:SAM-dependent methyltransferase
MVELGGGTGAFGLMAIRRGWTYSNWDVSPRAVRCAQSLSLDARLFNPDAAPPLAPHCADAIVMWEVLEHVWDVHEYLRVIRQALAPRGLLALSTPHSLRRGYGELLARGASESSPPVHLNFFTPESLEHVLRRAGFSVVTIIQPRLCRPGPNVRSVVASVRIACRVDHPKTVYAIAQPG